MTIDNGPVICYLAPGNSLPPQPTRTDDLPSLSTSYGISGAVCGARLRNSAGQGCGPYGSRSRTVPCKTIGPPSPHHPSQPHCDGSLGRHRRRGHGFVVVASRLGPQQREPDTLQCGQRGSVQRYQPCLRLIRALRPSICRAAFSGWEAKHEKIRKAKRSVSCFGLFRGCYPAVSLPAGSVPNAA